jgi:hypothetical protein
MDINTWREKRSGELYILPSGLTVKLKPVTLYDLAMQGDVPAPLTGAMDELMNKDKRLTVQTLPEFGKVADLVVKAAMVEPAIAEDADESHITLNELSAMDKIQVYVWATREVQALVPFRAQPDKTGGDGQDGAAVRDETERDSGD